MSNNEELYRFKIAVMSVLVQDTTIAVASTDRNLIFSPLSPVFDGPFMKPVPVDCLVPGTP